MSAEYLVPLGHRAAVVVVVMMIMMGYREVGRYSLPFNYPVVK